MAEQVIAAVMTGKQNMELREFPMPDVAPDAALLKVEAAGMCAAYEMFNGDMSAYLGTNPVILGHENVGTLVKVGNIFAKRWGVEEGDYLALEEYSPCYYCEYCLMGEYRRCYQEYALHNPDYFHFGSTAITRAPSLWGGYSQYLYLPLNVAFQKMPRTVRPEVAALLLPLANGVQWGCKEPQTGPGKTLLVQGPGPKGLGCVLAASIFGASKIIISGLTKDARRLEVAKALGADHVIDVQKEDLVEKVMEYTDGEGVDGTVDATTSESPKVSLDALECLRRGRGGGIMVMQGRSVPDFPFQKLSDKYGGIRFTRGHNHDSVRIAGDWIASGKYTKELEMQISHQFPLSQTAEACRVSGGEGGDPLSVIVNPWASE